MALVSVIITTFNRPAYLREAVKSVLDQDFSDLELIIIDDASREEETACVAGSFFDPRINFIKNKTNVGSTASLNIGLDVARGKYIAILDDDDIWVDAQKLSKQVKFLEERPDYVLAGTNVIVVDGETKKEITRTHFPRGDGEIRQTIFRSNPFAHSSVMYLRDKALGVGGYDSKLPRGKDYDLILKLGKLGKMAVLRDYSLMYREALPEGAELVYRRLKDAKATAVVLWRHRGEYPGFWGAYVKILTRALIFSVIRGAPVLYGFYRKLS